MKNTLTLLMLLSSSLLFAEGGGVGNGGYSLLCKDTSPRMVESIAASQMGATLMDSSTGRKDLIETVVQKLRDLDNQLGNQLEQQLRFQGPSENWQSIEGKQTFDHYLTKEELGDCTPVQVAYFETGRSLRVEPGYTALAKNERAVLELHEALYRMGVLFYSHMNPVKTQKLLAALLVQSPNSAEVLAEALRIFKGSQKSFDFEYEGVFWSKDCLYSNAVLHKTGYGTQIYIHKKSSPQRPEIFRVEDFSSQNLVKFNQAGDLEYKNCTLIKIDVSEVDLIRELLQISGQID